MEFKLMLISIQGVVLRSLRRSLVNFAGLFLEKKKEKRKCLRVSLCNSHFGKIVVFFFDRKKSAASSLHCMFEQRSTIYLLYGTTF